MIDALGLFDLMPNCVYWNNRARYNALNDRDILALRQANALDLIVAHLVSLSHLGQIAPQKRSAPNAPKTNENLQDFLAAMVMEPAYHDRNLIHF